MLDRSDSENIASNYFKMKKPNRILSGESIRKPGKSGFPPLIRDVLSFYCAVCAMSVTSFAYEVVRVAWYKKVMEILLN